MAVASIGINNVVDQRITQQIKDQLGASIMALLDDDAVFEVFVNGDGSVRTSGMGRKDYHSDIVLTSQQRLSFLGTIASLEHVELNKSTPIIDGVLPWDGSRISGCIPPADLNGPSYNIRKKAKKVFTLDDYIQQGRVTQEEKELIHKAIRDRKNILVAGPTGSGKTTMTNALIHALYEISPHERIITMEQVPELQVSHEDWVGMQTTDTVNFAQLIRNALRRSPDRIIIGEVRDQAAMDLLEAWNTGHPGGISTIHSDNCYKTLGRLRTLIARGGAVNQEPFIAEAINLILYVDRIAGFGPVLSQIMEVHDYDNVTGKYDVTWIKRGFELPHSLNDGNAQIQGV